MLVLTRKLEEKIHIGEDITITVLKTKGRAVQIGIEAPRDIRVMRGELIAAEVEAAEAQPTEALPATMDEEEPPAPANFGGRLSEIVAQCQQASVA